MKYKHLFFDLDNTLWDFDRNAFETFNEIYQSFLLEQKKIPSIDAFIQVYTVHNTRLWNLYRDSFISKEELRDTRFLLTLKEFGIDDQKLADKISEEYIFHSPRKGYLYPGTIETLEQLKNHFQLHIITNGFEEIQHIKLEFAGLTKYFDNVFTSEQAESKKPDAGIFKYALKQAGASAEESLMIGDDLEVDIIGAKAVGMDTIYFDPLNRNTTTLVPTHRVDNISDIPLYMDSLN